MVEILLQVSVLLILLIECLMYLVNEYMLNVGSEKSVHSEKDKGMSICLLYLN